MPPKKRKQNQKNAFYFFMLDFKAKKESEGVKFPGGLREVAEKADFSWKGLDPKTKRHYESMAERAKSAGGVRYNTQGQTYEEAEREREEVKQKQEQMVEFIRCSVQCAGREGLKCKNFYFFHVNHFGAMENVHFVPCEVAVLSYNIEHGFRRNNIFHEFIMNKGIPTGYSFKAKTHSDDTHKCPLPPESLGSCRVDEVIKSIWDLMERNGDIENDVPPPLYTMDAFMAEGVDFFNIMYRNGEGSFRDFGIDFSVFRVYPLEELFFNMKNFTLKPVGERLLINGVIDNGFPFKSTAADILKGDIYDYAPDIACEYHEEQDVRQHCSRSFVIRWSYLFSDYLCANLDIPMKHITHTPRNTDLWTRKVIRQLDCLKLDKPEGPVDHGQLVNGSEVPTPHPLPSASSKRGLAYSAVAAPSSSETVPDTRGAAALPSQFDDDSEDDVDEVAEKPCQDNAPLRQPKTQVKSSRMFDSMFPPLAASSATNSYHGYASPLPGPAFARGRGRGRFVLPSGKVVSNSHHR